MPDIEGQLDPETYEEEHVHSVYEQIASHFSSTRYKPWPIVERFLKELPHGSVGLDIGCGNGKYLAVNPNVFIIASDRSANLARIAAQHQPHTAIVADNLSLPHPTREFEFAISIAVVHHMSTPARRIEAIRAILDTLRPSTAGIRSDESHAETYNGGRALVYVWALEQKDSRRGWGEGHEQDVMVPWVMKSRQRRNGPVGNQRFNENQESITYQRYYHLYKKGELERDITAAGGRVLSSGYEKDNWWAIAGRL